MRIAFNPSTVAALIAPPNNKDITFDLRGQNIFARGVKFCGTDTNTWRDIKINNVSIDSNILDLRDGDNTTLTNINGVVTINSTQRPVVDNLTSDSTTSSLSANQGRVLAGLINTLSTNISNQYALRDGSNATGRWRGGLACLDVRDTNYTPYDLSMGLQLHFFDNNTNNLKDGGEYNGVFSFRQWASGSDWSGGKAHQLSFTDNGNIWHRTSSGDDSWGTWKKLAYSTDIPSSLKNPYALTISLNGTSQGPYDGSTAKNINITPSSIGAATSDHNHDGRYVRYYAVTTLDCNNLAVGLTAAGVSATNAAHSNHSTFLYISDVGTPFQIQIPDSSVPYIYKRYYSSSGWSEWFKLNAGYADSAGSATKLETIRNIFGLPFDGTNDIGGLSFLIDSNIDTDTSAIKWTAKLVGKYTSASTGGQGLLIGAATDRKYCRGGGIAAYATNVWGNNTNLAIYKSQGNDYDVKPVEVVTITENLNVGIGTTSPQMKLHVNGNGIYLNSTATCGINMYSSHSESSISYKSNDGIRTVFGTYTNRTFLWNESIGEHVSILSSNGYFGIGTVSPSSKLTVNGVGNDQSPVQLVNASRNGTWVYTASFLAPNLTSNNNNAIFIGKAHSTCNAFGLTHMHIGDGYRSNYAALEVWGVGNVQRWYYDRHSSFLHRADFSSLGSDASYMNSALQIREHGYNGVQADTWANAPRMSWHWSGRVQTQIGLGSDNELYLSKNDFGNAYKLMYETGTWGINITGNAASATKSEYSRSLLGRNTSGEDYDTNSANLVFAEWNTMNDNRWYLKATGYECRVAFANNASRVYGSVGDTGTHELIRCDMNNDQFRIIAGSNGNNNGWAEIATADDGNEPIYVRQYTGVFSSVVRTLTLLDANGYTHFPSYINIGGNENNNSSPDRVWGSNGSDSYLRSYRTSALNVNYASSAGNADTLDGTHLNGIFTAFGNNGHNITATIGGTTKSFLVNWAADSDKLDGYHENSFLRYRGDTSTDQEATLWSQIGIKEYYGALPDGLTDIYNWGGVISLPGTYSRFEIYAAHLASSGTGLYYRSGWDSDKKSWLKFIDSSNIGSQSVNYANSAGNADTVDGYHATDGRTFTGNINWSPNWNDTWSDGTNKHPWYGFDHRYENTGAYSTTISDYFGMTIKTANTLRLDFGTLLLNGTSIYSINVASATKLQTSRSIWGQSFDGTRDVNGTIYINNSDSSNGAIRLNNNVNSNARISAISDQVIFNTGNAIRFGETSWDWNQWAGLKYTHSNKTIYLGIADGSVFNSNSTQSGGTLNLRAGISDIDLNSGTSIRGLPTNGSPYSSRVTLNDTSISLSAYGDISMSTGPGAIKLTSGYSGIKLSCQGNNASIDSGGFKVEASKGVYLNSGNSGNVYLCQGGGKVGIGTGSPQTALDIRSNEIAPLSVNGAIRLATNPNGTYYYQPICVAIGGIGPTPSGYEIYCNTNITHDIGDHSTTIIFNDIPAFQNEIRNYILSITNLYNSTDMQFHLESHQNKLLLKIYNMITYGVNIRFIIYKCKEDLKKYPFP